MTDKCFSILIEDVERLYKQFQRRVFMQIPYGLGELELEEPLQNISVNLYNNSDTYNAKADITISPNSIIRIPEKAIKKKFETRHDYGLLYILGENNRFDYCIENDDVLGLYITCGKELKTIGRKFGTLEEFVAFLDTYANILATTVNGVYSELGKQSPEITLHLKPRDIMD